MLYISYIYINKYIYKYIYITIYIYIYKYSQLSFYYLMPALYGGLTEDF